MKEIELIGGPLDGAHAEGDKILKDGENILIEDDEVGGAVYTVHDGVLEFNAGLTFGR